MTESNLKLFFTPAAERDIEEEVDYLRQHGAEALASSYIRAVNRTTALLLATPYIGRHCNFHALRYRNVRRFPVHSPFDKRLVFYTPDNVTFRVDRILHGARNWAVLFR